MSAPTPLSMPGANEGISAVQAQAPTPPVVAAPVAPAAPAAPPAVPAVATPPATPAPAAPPTPPWGADDFDPNRAWNLITNLREELSEYKGKADPIIAAHEEQRRAAQSETERIREDLNATATQLQTWQKQAIQARAEALTTGRFVDTETAIALVGDLSPYVTPDGIDDAALAARFDQLATAKPFLLASAPQSQGFTPNRGQGRSADGPIGAEQVARHAQSQGDYKGSLRAKTDQLLQVPRL